MTPAQLAKSALPPRERLLAVVLDHDRRESSKGRPNLYRLAILNDAVIRACTAPLLEDGIKACFCGRLAAKCLTACGFDPNGATP